MFSVHSSFSSDGKQSSGKSNAARARPILLGMKELNGKAKLTGKP